MASGMEKGFEKNAFLPELVLRGKELEKTYKTEETGVMFHVLWGKYEDDGTTHEGYGLQMEDKDGMIKKIPDLSTDSQKVCMLADRMNRCKVSRYHFDDVVQDFLAAV